MLHALLVIANLAGAPISTAASLAAAGVAEARTILSALRSDLLASLDNVEGVAEVFRSGKQIIPQPCRVRAYFSSIDVDESLVAPCRSSSGDDTSLGTAFLMRLRAQLMAEGKRGFVDSSVVDEAPSWQTWPCSVHPVAERRGQDAPGLRSVLWTSAVWLRRCGVRGLLDNWPDNDAGWSNLRSQVGDGLHALASVRRDARSLLCAQSLKLVVSNASSTSVEADSADSDMDVIGNETVPLGKGRKLRCPRCARAVAADRASVVALEDFRRRLLEEQSESPLQRHDAAREAECAGADRAIAAQLGVAWSGGGGNAVITTTELLECGVCELAGVVRFVQHFSNVSLSPLEDSQELANVAIIAGALAEVRCAAETAELVDVDSLLQAVRALEDAVWRGAYFPLLQEVASRAILGLLRAGRLQALVASWGLAAGLCGHSSEDVNGDFRSKVIPTMKPPRSRLHQMEQAGTDSTKDGTNSGISNWVLDYELWALGRWGGLGGSEDDPLRMALAYLDLAAAVQLPLQVAASLTNAALWLTEVSSGQQHFRVVLSSVAVSFAAAAENIAIAFLAPGEQFVILSAATFAAGLHSQIIISLGAIYDRFSMEPLQSRLRALAGQMPFWSPPTTLVADVVALGSVASRLHTTFAGSLRILDLHELHSWPGVASAAIAAPLSLYEGALAEGRLHDARDLLPSAEAAALRLRTQAADPIPDAVSSFLPRQDAFVAVRGLRSNPNAPTEFLLERPRVEADSESVFSAAFASQTLAQIVDDNESVPLEAFLATGDSSPHSSAFGHRHPFQRLGGNHEATGAVLALQRVASLATQSLDSEVPSELRAAAQAVIERALHGKESIAQELRLQCSVGVSSVASEELRLGEAVAEVVAEGVDPDSALAKFASALTKHTQGSEAWFAELALVRQICALRAAGRLAKVGVETIAGGEWNDSHSKAHPETHTWQQSLPSRGMWLQSLAKAHAMLLGALGFAQLDPGSCWDSEFSFASCCSVGDYQHQCWQRGFSEVRCCGGLLAPGAEAVEAGVVPEMVKLLAEPLCREPVGHLFTIAVAAWLRSPNGRSNDDRWEAGRPWSAIVAEMMEKEASACSNDGHGAPTLEVRDVNHLPGAGVTNKSGRDLILRAVGKGGSLVPSPWLGNAVGFRAALEPSLRITPAGSTAQVVGDGVVSLSLEDLKRRAQRSSHSADVLQLAGAAPLFRSLDLLSAKLQGLRSKAADAVAKASAGATSSSQVASPPTNMHWMVLKPGDMASLQPGEKVRIKRSGQFSLQEEAEVVDALDRVGASSDPGRQRGVVHRLRVVKAKARSMRYCDLSDPSWTVSVLRAATSALAAVPSHQEHAPQVWPDCVTQGETIRGAGNAALFVNLVGLGITEGCFRGDCSHSDHFTANSPASCARACASLRACKWWSYWAAHSGGVCWLRRSDAQRAVMINAVSGAADCVPPAGSTKARRSEPTLFELAHSSGHASISPSHPLHQWDLTRVLQAFGRSTPSQVEVADFSVLQRSARLFARRAQRLEQWKRAST